MLLLVSGLCAGLPLSAQPIQGTIYYERKIDVRRRIDDEQMKAMAPKFQIGQYELLYRDSLCVYRAAPKDESPDPFDNQSGGNHIVIRFGGPGENAILFSNLSCGKLFEQNTLEDVQYVITDSIRPLPWKLSADTLSILGHLCKKATAISPRNQAPVIAWYCEDIPLPIGPDHYAGLPGAILQVDMDNGFVVFTATGFSRDPDPKSLKIPAGKLITRAAFEKKMDEVMGPADSKGRRIIRN